MTQEAYELVVQLSRRAEEDVHSSQFAIKIAEFELRQANAALLQTDGTDRSADVSFKIFSPIDGEVLRVFQESATMLPPGAPLMEIGDRRDLEVVVDLLSGDAERISPGAKMYLQRWGTATPLLARVRLIEPQAFLKVSALGVEEQRVNVIGEFLDPPEMRLGLGDAYRVEARIVIWEDDDILKANAGACFRYGDGWAVYRITNGRARLTHVEIGHSNGMEVEILGGLSENDQIVAYPSDQVSDGTRVSPRRRKD
jgi:HlyD family secretion protein